MANLQQGFMGMITFLQAWFAERDLVAHHLVASLLGRHHVWLFGPPGTAKSQMISTLANMVEEASVFDRLCNSDMKAEDFLGPIMMSGLANDEYKRAVQGFLPTAHIAFLDEGGRTSGRVRDQILRLMNERYYMNGAQRVDSPLISMYSGSNQLLTNSYDEAFVDRFLVYLSVDFVRNGNEFMGLLDRPAMPAPPTVTLDELRKAQEQVSQVAVPQDFRQAVLDFRDALAGDGIVVSDRRWISVVKGLKSFAWLDGETELEAAHLEWAADMLWKAPKERRIIMRHIGQLANPLVTRAVELGDQADRMISEMPDAESRDFLRSAGRTNRRLRELVDELSRMVDANPKSRTARVQEILSGVKTKQRKLADEVRAKSGL